MFNAEIIDLIMTDIEIYFNNRKVFLDMPVCINKNRYYLPMLGFCKQLGFKFYENGGIVTISGNGSIALNLEHCRFTVFKSELYISLFDIIKFFGLFTKWDYENRRISIFINNKKINFSSKSRQRQGLIRLEDITAGGEYLKAENLEKLRVIADLLYENGVVFHIAWIPRYINGDIDNDISRDISMENANFLFTLDYFIYRNGFIGLHGYTHQYENEISGEGTEFSSERYIDEHSIKERLYMAIDTANKLDLPYEFFECPHYAETSYQQSIFEQYFDIIYEPYVGIWGKQVVKSPRNGRTLYIPTPLGYMDTDIDDMVKRIERLDNSSLASLFYHPYEEFSYINNKLEYDKNSPLHKIIEAMYKKGCEFVSVKTVQSAYL